MINEVCPKREVIDTVIKEVVVPILKQMESDIGKVNYKCSVYVGDREEISTIVDSSGTTTIADVFQPIRMRFRTIF